MKCRSALFSLAISLGLATAADGAKFAVVVGVNDCPAFRMPDGSRPRSLRGAEADADAVASRLRSQFGFSKDDIRLIKGQDATLAKVRETLAKVTRLAAPGDQVVFHFSGHGTQVADQRPWDEADQRDEALCLADTNSQGGGVLLDDELGLWLDELRATEITVVLDCCHAGTGTKALDDEIVTRSLPMPLPAPRPGAATDESWRELTAQSKSLDKRLTALFACQPSQQAYERRLPEAQSTTRAGQFTHYLLEGLDEGNADADRDGVVSCREAVDYVRRRLDVTFNGVRSTAADRQVPQLESSAAALPLFGVR